MNAGEIAAAVIADRSAPPSRTRTPAQSVNRDLHAAARRGDPRLITGPGRGQFHADSTVSAKPPPAPRKPTARLPTPPLATLVAGRGGLAACGIRHHPHDSPDRVRTVARLQRAYTRARENGWIGVRIADMLAITALTRHPAEIWPQWWDAP